MLLNSETDIAFKNLIEISSKIIILNGFFKDLFLILIIY
jgi:hypothetical protein